MKLIFLYGPPASGKLTVAKILSERTGLVLFHNHLVHDMLNVLFPLGDKNLTDVRNFLARKFRLEVIEAAARYDISFITTFGQTHRDSTELFRAVKRAIEDNKGQVVFIQLLPSREALLTRVESPSRKGRKLDSEAVYTKLLDEHDGFYSKFPDTDHLTIDNTDLSPEQVAEIIFEHISEQ